MGDAVTIDTTGTIRSKPLHPVRRRLIIAAVIWVLVIRTGLGIVSEWLNLAQPVLFGIGSAIFLALFLPLLPVLSTIWFVVGVVRFRRAGDPVEGSGVEPARDRMDQ